MLSLSVIPFWLGWPTFHKMFRTFPTSTTLLDISHILTHSSPSYFIPILIQLVQASGKMLEIVGCLWLEECWAGGSSSLSLFSVSLVLLLFLCPAADPLVWASLSATSNVSVLVLDDHTWDGIAPPLRLGVQQVLRWCLFNKFGFHYLSLKTFVET